MKENDAVVSALTAAVENIQKRGWEDDSDELISQYGGGDWHVRSIQKSEHHDDGSFIRIIKITVQPQNSA